MPIWLVESQGTRPRTESMVRGRAAALCLVVGLPAVEEALRLLEGVERPEQRDEGLAPLVGPRREAPPEGT